MSDSKVWAVTPPSAKIMEAAQSWGEVHSICGRYCYVNELSDDNSLPADFFNPLASAVEWFVPQTDYLLLNGDHAMLAELTALLALKYTRFNVLRYDKQRGGFHRVTVDTKISETKEKSK